MNKQELIEVVVDLPVDCSGYKPKIDQLTTLELIKLLDEPETGHADEAPRYVKNILARLRELPLHDREVWLKAIMSEFEQDFSHAKWREGYEQGKVEGVLEREKVTIPQFVANWIEYCKFTHVDLQHALIVGDVYFYNYANQKDFSKLKEFLEAENNQATFARAWLDSYEVEKEKRYLVKLKGVFKGYEYLNFKFGRVWTFSNEEENEEYRTCHTKKELEDAGFGWVFDCEGIEIEEVE